VTTPLLKELSPAQLYRARHLGVPAYPAARHG